jgi:hypothetical protein
MAVVVNRLYSQQLEAPIHASIGFIHVHDTIRIQGLGRVPIEDQIRLGVRGVAEGKKCTAVV